MKKCLGPTAIREVLRRVNSTKVLESFEAESPTNTHYANGDGGNYLSMGGIDRVAVGIMQKSGYYRLYHWSLYILTVACSFTMTQ